ncbi:YbaB/EbfC family nucleoid-associated protein [Paludicola sp. MB14-C6]|uniref:YbaB/EbfC family nucleoid-associated protein n=1 Tax=Paludihabitans sp. MB14-C6 TaxID=3070656 RepID=UPI0027DCEC16|nr:YbaB/EbfC family nucleoid-associated protein [Paludicola sp. MB14-C6]WMJ21933.1 YbaB/EbfC family nucleoid-associated protein [Paludicola sp. MB14-C6]
MKARLPQGMGGGPQNMQAMLKQAQKMQEDMAALTEELEAKNYEVTVGGGAVKAVINGKKEIVALDIKPEVVDAEDVEMLQDLIISAVNEAIRKAETDSETEMNKITGGMKMPF